MKTTNELLSEFKDSLPRDTWTQVAKDLELNETYLFAIRTGKKPLPPAAARRLAKKLNIPEDFVILWQEIEKHEGKETADVWKKIAHNYEQKIARI